MQDWVKSSHFKGAGDIQVASRNVLKCCSRAVVEPGWSRGHHGASLGAGVQPWHFF
jgi:hypothetical protein